MNRRTAVRSFFASIAALFAAPALARAGRLASPSDAPSAISTDLVVTFAPGELSECIDVEGKRQTRLEETLAAQILALDEMRVDIPLLMGEMNGLCIALRQAYPRQYGGWTDQSDAINLDVAWARGIANGRLPMQHDDRTHYILVSDRDERMAQRQAYDAAAFVLATNGSASVVIERSQDSA